MIATKTTALMLALGMLGIAGLMFGSPSVHAQNVNVASNEDNDEVEQENKAEIKQSVECEAENDKGVVNVASNDCDKNTQTAAVVQGNSNTDNDVQVAVADQSVCEQLALLGLQICGNEVEED